MRVVVIEDQDYGYLGYHHEADISLKVFGCPTLVETWMERTFKTWKPLPKIAKEMNRAYSCEDKNRHIHTVIIYDKEVIES